MRTFCGERLKVASVASLNRLRVWVCALTFVSESGNLLLENAMPRLLLDRVTRAYSGDMDEPRGEDEIDTFQEMAFANPNV